MFDAVYLTFGAIAWAIVAYKGRAWLRDRRNTDLGLICVMTGSVATVFLFSAPRLYRWFDQLLGVANLAIAVLYSAVMVFAAGAWVLLLTWTGRKSEPARRRSATRARVVVATIAGIWTVALVCFAVGRPDAVEHPRDFSTAYTSHPGVVAFLVLYIGIFGGALAGLGHLCQRFAASLRGSWLARGLRVIACGCWLGLVYCVGKLAGFVGSWAGVNMRPVSNGVAPLSASVAAILVLAGFAVPAFGPRVSAWRRLRRLHPLWREVTTQAPEVTMGQSRWMTWWPFADLEWRANRQMAEIRDVQRGIRRYVDAALIDIARDKGRSASLDDQHMAALVEAAALRRGLHNQQAGRVPPYDADSVVMNVSSELDQEHAHLVRVAALYRMPLVEAVLAEVQDYQEAQRL